MPRAPSLSYRSVEELGPGKIDLGNRAEKEDDEPHRISAFREQLEQALADVLDVEVHAATIRSGRPARRACRSCSGWRDRVGEERRAGDRGRARPLAGAHACRSSSTIEIAAPSRTPFSGPDPSTPRNAAMAMANSARLKRQMCRSAATSTRLMTAARTIAASTGCGRFRSSPDAKSTTTSVKSAAMRPESGVRAPALSLTSDCDIPPLTGNPRPRPASRLRGAEREQLLVGVEPIAVLLREHPADGGRFDRREDEARQRQRQQLIQRRARLTMRQPQRRQPLGHVAQQRDAVRLEVQDPRREDAAEHHEERDRPVLQP